MGGKKMNRSVLAVTEIYSAQVMGSLPVPSVELLPTPKQICNCSARKFCEKCYESKLVEYVASTYETTRF